MKKFIKQKGFSLMELVVYIGLFALLSVVVVNSLITVIRTYVAATGYRALQNNGELVMERITREIRSGSSVSASACGTNPGSLTINSVDASSVAHTNIFSVQNGAVQLTTDSVSAANLSTSEVVTTHLSFCSFTTTSGSGVKTKLTFTTVREVPVTATFYSTILLRQ